MVILIESTSELFPGVSLTPPLVLGVLLALALMANAIRSRRVIWDHSTIHYVGLILWGIGLWRRSPLDYWNHLHDASDLVRPTP